MLKGLLAGRAPRARAHTAALAAALALTVFSVASGSARAEPKDIRWGTGPIGSVGQKALVVLANLLNKEMPNYRITVLPMPGAVMTVKSFATD